MLVVLEVEVIEVLLTVGGDVGVEVVWGVLACAKELLALDGDGVGRGDWKKLTCAVLEGAKIFPEDVTEAALGIGKVGEGGG